MATFRLQVLIDYAEERSKQAAQELRKHRLRWAQEEQKKQQLEGYLEDYQVRLSSVSQNGISVSVMMDFRRFITKIEMAISTQKEEIVRCKQQWEAAQRLWNDREREVKAYHALRSRHEQAESIKENRMDQRLQDELAQNGHQRKLMEYSLSHK